VGRCGLDAPGSRQGPVVGCCELGNKHSGSIKGGEFLDKMRDYLATPCSEGKVVPVFFLTEHHATKAYWGREGIIFRILDIGTKGR
jgi:hypothetical protein